MVKEIQLSLIVPVYNRPDEVDELLESLTLQSDSDFEIVLVEDGSAVHCKDQVEKYKEHLTILYFEKPNSGPGQSRNYGSQRASGNYFIFLDSDCVIPRSYVANVRKELTKSFVDAFGGPDKASDSFSDIQKAINYAMTSFFTTGGIRGGGEKLDKFYPRSFNMGYSKDVFQTTKGFSKMRFGEDIDMSIRILKSGFQTKLLKDAWVFHKRRTNFRQFYKQVFNSGIARINLHLLHPGSLKLVHTLPSLFTVGSLGLLLFSFFFGSYCLSPLLILALSFCIDSSVRNKSIRIGFLSVTTSFIQLWGYGLGFISGVWNRLILKKDLFSAFDKNFYK